MKPINDEEKFKILMELSYDWEYWRLPNGEMKYVSPSCKRITGYSPQEFYLTNKLHEEIIHPDDRNRVLNHKHIEFCDKGRINPIQFRVITKSNDIIWIEHVCIGKNDENETFLGKRGSNRDITLRKETELELKQLRTMLPICASCKKIRDDKGYWEFIETYLKEHSSLDFTHGICPECAQKLYKEYL